MAGKSPYTDAEMARVYVTLTTNDGNIKRTARDTGVPASTVRQWRNRWEAEGPPPMELVEAEVQGFLDEAIAVRGMSLRVLRKKVELLEKDPDRVKVAELTTLMGVLDDKITRAQGLATGRVEHVHRLPSPDEIRAALGGLAQGAIEAAKARQADIIDAEIVEQSPRELPSPR